MGISRFLVLFAALWVSLSLQSTYCTYEARDTSSGQKYYYDLNKMHHVAGEGNTFYVNICGETKQTGCKPQQCSCQQAANLQFYGCGILSSMTLTDGEKGPGSGVTVWYGEGQACSDGPLRETFINIDCDPTADPGYIYNATEGDCIYYLFMHSTHGCPKTTPIYSKLSAGSILIILFLICAFIYLAGGSLFMWLAKGKTGMEVIPNYEFWKDFPALLQDGAMFAIHGFKKEGYTQIDK